MFCLPLWYLILQLYLLLLFNWDFIFIFGKVYLYKPKLGYLPLQHQCKEIELKENKEQHYLLFYLVNGSSLLLCTPEVEPRTVISISFFSGAACASNDIGALLCPILVNWPLTPDRRQEGENSSKPLLWPPCWEHMDHSPSLSSTHLCLMRLSPERLFEVNMWGPYV